MWARSVPTTNPLQEALLGRTRHSDANVAWAPVPVRPHYWRSHMHMCVCMFMISSPSAAITHTFPSGLDPWPNKRHSHSISVHTHTRSRTHICRDTRPCVCNWNKTECEQRLWPGGSGDALLTLLNYELRSLSLSLSHSHHLTYIFSHDFTSLTCHQCIFSI